MWKFVLAQMIMDVSVLVIVALGLVVGADTKMSNVGWHILINVPMIAWAAVLLWGGK